MLFLVRRAKRFRPAALRRYDPVLFGWLVGVGCLAPVRDGWFVLTPAGRAAVGMREGDR